VGTVQNFFAKLSVAEVKMETQSLSKNDKILIIGPTTGVYEGAAEEIRVELQPVAETKKGDHCSIAVSSVVRRGDKVYKLVKASILEIRE
jgi:putative protease